MEVRGQLQAPAALSLGKKPLDRRMDGPHYSSGRGGEEKNFLLKELIVHIFTYTRIYFIYST
jgi:hypothetical protein